MKNYKRLLAYIKPYLGRFALAIICIICASGANLYLPWIIKDMIDKVLAERDMAMLNFISVSIVVVFAIRGIFYYGQSYLVSYIGQRVVVDRRDDELSDQRRRRDSICARRQPNRNVHRGRNLNRLNRDDVLPRLETDAADFNHRAARRSFNENLREENKIDEPHNSRETR